MKARNKRRASHWNCNPTTVRSVATGAWRSRGLGRHKEAIEALERAVDLSRAPIFVGNLGFGYGRAGQMTMPNRLLRELEERGSRGEYMPAFTALAIYIGLADVPQFAASVSARRCRVHAAVGDTRECRLLLPGSISQRSRNQPATVELYGW